MIAMITVVFEINIEEETDLKPVEKLLSLDLAAIPLGTNDSFLIVSSEVIDE